MRGNYVFSGILILAFGLCAATTTLGQKPDLSMRTGVYLTGTKTDSIDLKNDPYAAAGKTLSVKTKQAQASGDNIYEFNVGIMATREGGSPSNSLTTSIEGTVDGSGFTDRKEFTFPANQQVAQVIIKAILHLGLNHLHINIDPGNGYAESNENNNSVTVDLNLTASPPIRIHKVVDYSTTNILYRLKGRDPAHAQMSVNIFEDRQLQGGTTVGLNSDDAIQNTCHHSKTNASPVRCTFHFGVIAKRAWQTEVEGPYVVLAIYVDNDPAKISAFDVNMKKYMTDKDIVFYLDLDAGTHTMKVVIDPKNAVAEDNENNNSFSITIKVNP